MAYWKRYAKRTPLIAGNSLEPSKPQRKNETSKRDGLRIAWIGQSAAKPLTEESSTTISEARVGTSVSKRGALNHIIWQGEDIVCALQKCREVCKH